MWVKLYRGFRHEVYCSPATLIQQTLTFDHRVHNQIKDICSHRVVGLVVEQAEQ